MIEENEYWIDMAPATEEELEKALKEFKKAARVWAKPIENGQAYDVEITLSLRTCDIMVHTISEEDEVKH